MSTKDIVYVALFAALTAVLGLFPPLTLPVISVPISAQSMGAMVAGAIAGSRRGGLALLVFCALVAAGLPLMAGGRGGLGIFLSPSGGFVLSWPFAAAVIGYLCERNQSALGMGKELCILALGGVVLVYALGIPWAAAFAHLTVMQASIGSLGFIPGDIAKVVLAAVIARSARRAYPTLELRS